MTFKQELQELSWANSPLNIENIKKRLIEAAGSGKKSIELDCYDERVLQWLKSENFEVSNNELFGVMYILVSWE